MSKPKVSVVVPSYNHAKYIDEALESILKQNFKDYEILIIDDASNDNSITVIDEFISRNPELQIRFTRNAENQGGVETLNHLISMATGEYIALINSDDVWLPDKLDTQVKFLDQNADIGAIFTQALIVDEDLKPFDNQELQFNNIFLQKNRSRGEWLRRFFFEQNCLCHPSILIRRKIYDQIGLYDPRYRQIPDLQMWVRLVKHVHIQIIEQPLVLLRWHAENTSIVNTTNKYRGVNELFHLYRDFFTSMPEDVLIKGFQDLFRNKSSSETEELVCEEAFLYFTPTSHIKALYYNIGFEKLYSLLGNDRYVQVLLDKFSFSYKEFLELAGKKFFDKVFFHSLMPDLSNPMLQFDQSQTNQLNFASWLKITLRSILVKFPPLFKIANSFWKRLHRQS